jgi:hypothetical protein
MNPSLLYAWPGPLRTLASVLAVTLGLHSWAAVFVGVVATELPESGVKVANGAGSPGWPPGRLQAEMERQTMSKTVRNLLSWAMTLSSLVEIWIIFTDYMIITDNRNPTLLPGSGWYIYPIFSATS